MLPLYRKKNIILPSEAVKNQAKYPGQGKQWCHVSAIENTCIARPGAPSLKLQLTEVEMILT